MIKNNIKALIIHFAITFLCVVFSMFGMASSAKWASEEAAQNHHFNMMVVALVILCCAILLYFFMSKRYCSKQKNIIYSFISVSLVAITGILFWASAFSRSPAGLGGRLLNSSIWENYSLYIGYSFMFLYEGGINNPYIFLIMCFVPSVVMSLGTRYKRN